ncbi:MAG: 16S rRNA (guanine(966)-N(2))-methyltransferase RsmD [Acidobacteriota bacterium]|nr:16S rRNA (guanine(966)-N(2))-methyltransferase RsmD [Acidobacteriota bacterium]
MRIISGTYRGLRLRTLKGGNLRPTTDQLRETLFDVLGPKIQGATFLDAYAGTGAVGMEALSRGASDVVFIEHHRPASQLIRENLAALKIDSGYNLLTCAVLTGLERLERDGEHFDVIFLDPPYEEIREYHHTMRQLARGPLLLPSSIVVVEHSKHVKLEENYLTLHQTRLLRHGDAQLAFYRPAAETSGQ